MMLLMQAHLRFFRIKGWPSGWVPPRPGAQPRFPGPAPPQSNSCRPCLPP